MGRCRFSPFTLRNILMTNKDLWGVYTAGHTVCRAFEFMLFSAAILMQCGDHDSPTSLAHRALAHTIELPSFLLLEEYELLRYIKGL